MKRILAVFLLIVLLIPSALAEEDETEPVWVLCQPTSWVTIRGTPRKGHNEEGRAYAGDQLWTDWKEKNGYLHVFGTFEAGEGWVKKCYLTSWEPEIYPQGRKFTVRVKKVNRRQYIGGKRKGWLKKDAVVTVWLETPDWCVTDYGYIQTRYLEESEE